MIWHYLVRRLFLLSFVFFALTCFAFSLGHLFPGDPLVNFSGISQPDDELLPILVQQYQLDNGYLQQYIAFLQRILQGDWGLSLASQQPVLYELSQVFPATLELVAYALLISFVLGVPLGLLAAIKASHWSGRVISTIALLGYSLPIFWWALLMIMLFSIGLGWFPTSGRISVLYEIPSVTGFMLPDILLSGQTYWQAALQDAIRHLWLPAFVLATYPTTVMIRFTRDAMLNVWQQSYIKTARAKGLSRSQVLYRHGLRNAMLPVMRQLGLQFSTLVTLAMISELIFSWPGIGLWLLDSISQRNYPAIQGGLLVISSLVILVNILMDVLHTLFNPLARKQANG
ncbi:ABC transporter permease [Alkalimonas amylolytica]|uniref:Cationic peptide transport system permease protein n=1 Tax=Alkalimonas amylolytica TaxID=152573 RepID=A0A1H4F678_ALKAM|nr:ABC transporter permease [Alkalimonas amylolytica]SEA92420.1 cationic peptide transport system permease protein [Alkalimonas amylolytica]